MKRVKKGIALVLALCMMAGMISYYPIGDKVKASETETVTEVEGYTNRTFSTVGLTEASYEVKGTQKYAGATFTLEHSAFSGYVIPQNWNFHTT